jgi:hypothetical protein
MIVIGDWGYTNQKPITIMRIGRGARKYGAGHAGHAGHGGRGVRGAS